ncbi:MAG: (Fe-S)-binding protein [Proteobacteria bacterium]|nr:(Fe-S)-binding protein [Pseudomonadota bacterium]
MNDEQPVPKEYPYKEGLPTAPPFPAESQRCAKCGACTSVCPVAKITGNEAHTARGRMHLLGKLTDHKHSEAFLDIVSKCLLCGACTAVCPREINHPRLVAEARHKASSLFGPSSFRSFLALKTLAHPNLLSAVTNLFKLSSEFRNNLPPDSGLRIKLGIPSPQGTSSPTPHSLSTPAHKPDILIFSGCLAHHLTPAIEQTTAALASTATGETVHRPDQQGCCGLASFSAGDLAVARRLAQKNITAFADHPQTPILTPCASCYSHLHSYPDLFKDDREWLFKAKAFSERVNELSTFLMPRLPPLMRQNALTTPPLSLTVVYHDPCHLKHRKEMATIPRRLLAMTPGINLQELPHGSQCCGLGGLFHLNHQDLSQRIAESLLAEILEARIDRIVTSCSGCLIQFHRLLPPDGRTKAIHLAMLLAHHLPSEREAFR